MRKLKCFVASAFGRGDVDQIYAKSIKPVLKSKKITPLRVDKVEHNDDIDDKIIELIDICDFCIADLTFARPSVYYEAGFVNGLGKQVIFTARSDHLRTTAGDTLGNLRVHFDLQMKPIITWIRPTPSLNRKLTTRINVVTKPIIRELQIEHNRRQDEAEFASLSQSGKFKGILKVLEQSFSSQGFRMASKERVSHGSVMGIKTRRGSATIALGFAVSTLTKSFMGDIQYGPAWHFGSPWLKRERENTTRRTTTFVFCCSLRKTPRARISEGLTSCCSNLDATVYSGSLPGSPHIAHFHILDGVKSLERFDDQVAKHLPLVGNL